MKHVLRQLYREPKIRNLRDFPRVLVLALALACIAAPVAAAAQGALSAVQVWAETMCVVLGCALLWAWWEIGGRDLR